MPDANDPSILPLDAVPWSGSVALVRTAVRRHRLMATAIVFVFVAVAGTAAALIPRTYSGELRILARRGTSVMSAIADPRRAVAPGFDAPSQGAVALGLSRAAITSIVHEGGLAERWRTARPALMRAKDALRMKLSGPLAQAELEEALVSMLEDRLRLRVSEDVITISVSWYDPEDVQRILNEAQKAFIKERARLDIESIQQSYEILLRATAAMTGQMEGRVSAFQSARSRALGDKAAMIPVKVTSATLSELRDRLLEQRAYREELERRRRMKRADLRVQLSQQQATLGARHPDRVTTEQALSHLDADDEGLSSARAAEDAALKEYRARGGSLDILDASSSTDKSMDPANANPDDDPTVIAARAQLRMTADGVQDLAMRTENARIELETARAAVPFKYIVTRPADRPRKPDSPNVPVLVMGGLVAGLLAGTLASLRRHIAAETARTGLSAMELIRLAPAGVALA